MSAPRPGFRHPTAVIGEPPEHRDWLYDGYPMLTPEIAKDAQVNAFVTVDSGLKERTRIGERTFLMAHVHVGHDAQIGDDCELAPGTVIGGHVKVGNGVRFGVNSCVRPFIEIGDGARIGMGAVVVDDVPAGEIWVGNPARPMRKLHADELSEAELLGWEEWYEAAHQQKASILAIE